MLDLAHIDAKIGRAEDHLKTVKALFLGWIKNQPHEMVQSFNEDRTKLSLVARIPHPPPLMDWTLILADCINNLRTALDYLVYTIAIHESGNNPPPEENKLAFVIANDWDDFKNGALKLGKLGKLSSTAFHAIESVQPYNRTHPEIPPPLSILQKLSNTDKHRMLRLAITTPCEWGLNFASPRDPSIEVTTGIATGEITDGSEVAWAISSKPNPNMSVSGYVGLSVAMWHGSRIGRNDPGSERSDFAALFDILVSEVRVIVQQVASKIS